MTKQQMGTTFDIKDKNKYFLNAIFNVLFFLKLKHDSMGANESFRFVHQTKKYYKKQKCVNAAKKQQHFLTKSAT